MAPEFESAGAATTAITAATICAASHPMDAASTGVSAGEIKPPIAFHVHHVTAGAARYACCVWAPSESRSGRRPVKQAAA